MLANISTTAVISDNDQILPVLVVNHLDPVDPRFHKITKNFENHKKIKFASYIGRNDRFAFRMSTVRGLHEAQIEKSTCNEATSNKSTNILIRLKTNS